MSLTFNVLQCVVVSYEPFAKLKKVVLQTLLDKAESLLGGCPPAIFSLKHIRVRLFINSEHTFPVSLFFYCKTEISLPILAADPQKGRSPRT